MLIDDGVHKLAQKKLNIALYIFFAEKLSEWFCEKHARQEAAERICWSCYFDQRCAGAEGHNEMIERAAFIVR